jgi:CBS domain-containing protein
LHQTAADLMIPRVVTALRETTIGTVARHLLSGHFSGLPVVEVDGKVIGVVTEFDVLGAWLRGEDLATLKAEDIMTCPPLCVVEDTPIVTILQHMIAQRILRIPVVRDGRLVGIISRANILRQLVGEQDPPTHVLALCYWCEQVLDDRLPASGKEQWCELQDYLRRYHVSPTEISFSPRFCSTCGPIVKALLGDPMATH